VWVTQGSLTVVWPLKRWYDAYGASARINANDAVGYDARGSDVWLTLNTVVFIHAVSTPERIPSTSRRKAPDVGEEAWLTSNALSYLNKILHTIAASVFDSLRHGHYAEFIR